MPHLTVAVKPGNSGAVAQRHGNLTGRSRSSQEFADRAKEVVDTLSGLSRNRKIFGGAQRRNCTQLSKQFGWRDCIDLVDYNDCIFN